MSKAKLRLTPMGNKRSSVSQGTLEGPMQFGKALAASAGLAAALMPHLAHAGTFDVEAATRAYLGMLDGASRARSDAYFEGGYWLLLWGAAIALFSDYVLLRTRMQTRFVGWAARFTSRQTVQVWLVALCYLLAGMAIALPWKIYTGFLRERAYGLQNQDFGGWLADYLLDSGLVLLVMSVLVVGAYRAMWRLPRYWWLAGSAIFTAGAAFLIAVSPVYIAPLFNHYAELPAGPVRERIVALAKASHVPAEHVYVYDASRQTNRISANVSGLGPTVRISLNDNLLNRTSEAEIAAVTAHEFGHYVLGHNWRLLVTIGLLAGVVFFLLHRLVPRLVRRHGRRWGIDSPRDPASMPVFGMALTVLGLLTTPVTNTIVRLNESAADAFGLELAREPDGFAMAAMRLSEYRKIEPGLLEEALLYDHPSGATRVRMAMEWKARNMPDAAIIRPARLESDSLAVARSK